MTRSYISIWIHTVWTTKHREPLLEKKWRIVFFQKMRQIAEEKAYKLDFINGVEDHLHCLFSLKATQNIAQIMKNIKGASSYWLNQQGYIKGKFSWQEGYYAASVSPDRVPTIRNYIRNQEEHHRFNSLDNELEYFEKFEDI